jgi:hypothetical protein
MTDRENLCREFTEFTGGHWHDFGETKCGENSIQFLHCRECNGYLPNPTYSNPADVLRVMKGVGKLDDFLYWLRYFGQEAYDTSWIETYIIEPDALMKAAIDFLKEREK